MSNDENTRSQVSAADNVFGDAQNFSLVIGGPLFQQLRRAHLSDDALLMVRQRIVAFSLFTWLPLLLAALEELLKRLFGILF